MRLKTVLFLMLLDSGFRLGLVDALTFLILMKHVNEEGYFLVLGVLQNRRKMMKRRR